MTKSAWGFSIYRRINYRYILAIRQRLVISIVDCLSQWWQDNQEHYQHLEELMIEIDGGSATRSNRTQFIKRIVELAKEIGLKIRLNCPNGMLRYSLIEGNLFCRSSLSKY